MQACTLTPDYFRVMNIPLLQGRYFDDAMIAHFWQEVAHFAKEQKTRKK